MGYAGEEQSEEKEKKGKRKKKRKGGRNLGKGKATPATDDEFKGSQELKEETWIETTKMIKNLKKLMKKFVN